MKWWFRRRKYTRLNRELVAQGSDARWVELVPGDWRYVDSVELAEPYPTLRPVKVVKIAGETFYVRQMRVSTPDGQGRRDM